MLADGTLTKFTGTYDDLGQPIRTEGELTIETVRRFKGQSATASVLTEVNFDPADILWRNLLFVGLTCAHARGNRDFRNGRMGIRSAPRPRVISTAHNNDLFE
jgi:hypothetical protein